MTRSQHIHNPFRKAGPPPKPQSLALQDPSYSWCCPFGLWLNPIGALGAHVHECVRACISARMHACVRVHVRACVRACTRACMRACVRVVCACVCKTWLKVDCPSFLPAARDGDFCNLEAVAVALHALLFFIFGVFLGTPRVEREEEEKGEKSERMRNTGLSPDPSLPPYPPLPHFLALLSVSVHTHTERERERERERASERASERERGRDLKEYYDGKEPQTHTTNIYTPTHPHTCPRARTHTHT